MKIGSSTLKETFLASSILAATGTAQAQQTPRAALPDVDVKAAARRSGPFPPEECPLRPPKAPRRHSRSTSAGRAIHAMPSLPSSGARRDATSAPVAVLPISQLYRNAPHTLQWGNAPQARIEPQLGKLEKDQASRSPGRAIYIVPHRGEHNRPEVSLKAPFSPRSA
jgi:hypothetical protein